MAHTDRECLLALIFLFMWLLSRETALIDPCKRGSVTVQPSPTIPLGAAANISCSLNSKYGCSHHEDQLTLFKSEKIIHVHQGQAFTFQVTNLPLDKNVFVCKTKCNAIPKVVCGVQISVGVPPEQPQNLSCVQTGENGTVACTWDPGRDTHLQTTYTLQLTGPNNDIFQARNSCQNCSHLALRSTLTPEFADSKYTVSVTAVNDLGNSSSFPFTFTFLDIVRPLPPWDIRISFLNDSGSNGILQWKDEGHVAFNQLRYRPLNSTSWNMVYAANAKGKYVLQDLTPFTEYEFQISSKLHLSKGSWSEWSESLKTQTPEEAPNGTLDVWYMKQNISYNRQNISLSWKRLSPSEARGKITYQVTLQEVTNKTILQNTTEDTSWTVVIPRTGAWTASVSATNSKGTSSPAHISVVDLCGAGLLAPYQISSKSENRSIMVTWQPPRKATSAVQEYIVEWRHQGESNKKFPQWLRVPHYNHSNLSALISENIDPNICYEIKVHALSEDQRGCSSIWGDSRPKAPLSGPHIIAVTEKEESIFLSWTPIPAQEQMGCILHYRIYWKERDSPEKPVHCEIPYRYPQNSYPISSLQPGVTYVLWMTALTAAGESPQGNEREFCPRGNANWKAFVVTSIFIAIIIVGIFSIRYFRQKTFAFLSALRPAWYSRTIPDPANSTWVKKYASVEEKTQPMDSLLMTWPTPEEPEPLIINEVLYQMVPVIRKPYCSKRGQGFQSYSASKEDTIYIASSPQPTGTLKAETRQIVNLYKVLGSRDPDSKLASPLTVTPVDYLPSHEGYLPSNIEDLSPSEAPPTDSLDLEHQHIPLSIFASSTLRPLTFCGERLTLDRLKMGYDSPMTNNEA
ncbi:interleukin-12 receptor subunit beta-2 isoform X1 [Meriones unguiculatus]|uniref:interleukin-12 receptor subunit beta-2 isoform X1 n=1 Tax=Meriones unguiculatus TaxID=10047 RepID=UPI000B4EB78D|nr:interleukin-12 receptor subunit beta-2-like [Meriones unguiculatus]XP_021504669.1 interleukin-12 receptor subunit beta-2 isoform X1 [Meriones unguiculatus]XP_060229722.1 interleukin-12 receptor subunit beta-2 isoform X1 [Meriones unguiculatus]